MRLSSTIFNSILEIRNSKLETDGTIYNNEHQRIAFVDDLTILARSEKELKRSIRAMDKERKKFGLEINLNHNMMLIYRSGYVHVVSGILYRYVPEQETEEAQLLVPREQVPKVLRESYYFSLTGHGGQEKTFRRISSRYYWTGMRRNMAEHVKKCNECKRYKADNLKPAGLSTTILYQFQDYPKMLGPIYH